MAAIQNSAHVQAVAEKEARSKLQRVLKHYLSQILFGCTNPHCTTPTCRTYSERSSRPFRPPTELTARALAYYHASLDDPTRGLCPHSLKCPLEDLEIDVQGRRAQLKKDSKSLGQNLFDTDAIYRSFYAELPGPVVASSDLDIDTIYALARARITAESLARDEDSEEDLADRIFNSLQIALGSLFQPPPIPAQTRESDSHRGNSPYINDEEAARLIFACLWWLSPWYDPRTEQRSRLADRLIRGIGARIFYECMFYECRLADSAHPNESQLLKTVIKELLEADKTTSTSGPTDHGAETTSTSLEWVEWASGTVRPGVTDHDPESEESDGYPKYPKAFYVLEILRAHVIKNWDGKGTLQRWTRLEVSIQLINLLYTHREQLRLAEKEFTIGELEVDLDPIEEAAVFLDDVRRPNTLHLFDYPFLFRKEALAVYFRVINATLMHRDFRRRKETSELKEKMGRFGARLEDWASKSLKVTLQQSLVLHVPRDGILEGSFAQLQGHEKRLFLKPLKTAFVHELAIDTGGVTPEYFNLVLRAAFQPAEGMFTTEPLYFQPASRQPAWKFELLGLIFALAVYNGISLPFTLPLAFYHNLLADSGSMSSYPEDPSFIEDGWPLQARSLREVLSFTREQVATAELHYCFSFGAFGKHVEVDMQGFSEGEQAWPGRGKLWPADHESVCGEGQDGVWGKMWPEEAALPPLDSLAWRQPDPEGSSAEMPLVTFENREQFVKDYIFWLTAKSVAPQLSAFRRGFLSCMHPKALRLLTPRFLKEYVEGDEVIDVEELQRITHYSSGTFDSTHPTVQDFWSIVEEYDNEDRRRLFKFVTAFERVPVTGMRTVVFEIGSSGDASRLPISRTCSGRLELPVYASKEILKEKLDMAIREGNEGFGFI